MGHRKSRQIRRRRPLKSKFDQKVPVHAGIPSRCAVGLGVASQNLKICQNLQDPDRGFPARVTTLNCTGHGSGIRVPSLSHSEHYSAGPGLEYLGSST
eukprot:3934929-Rhodomonas_salina.3